MSEFELTVNQVAQIAGCHINTVLNYEKRGLISSRRDFNGFRRFTIQEAQRLRGLLAVRTDRPTAPWRTDPEEAR